MNATELLEEIFAAALAQEQLSPAELTARAGLYASGISRIRATGDCRFSTLARLLAAGGLKLVVVKDEREAELLARGELF